MTTRMNSGFPCRGLKAGASLPCRAFLSTLPTLVKGIGSTNCRVFGTLIGRTPRSNTKEEAEDQRGSHLFSRREQWEVSNEKKEDLRGLISIKDGL